MLFEPVNCSIAEAKRNAAYQQELMQSYDAELQPLYKRLHQLEWLCEPGYSEELNELRERISRLEDTAHSCERYLDFWQKQAEWAEIREEEIENA